MIQNRYNILHIMWLNLLFDSTPQVAVIHNTDPGKCQSYCDIVQSNNCTFFIFDMRQNSCEIWTISKEDYEKNCIKREGPVNPNKNDKSCSKLANPCVVSVNFPSSGFVIYVNWQLWYPCRTLRRAHVCLKGVFWNTWAQSPMKTAVRQLASMFLPVSITFMIPTPKTVSF